MLVEIKVASHRTINFDPKNNEGVLRNNLDLLQEKRDEAVLRVAAYK